MSKVKDRNVNADTHEQQQLDAHEIEVLQQQQQLKKPSTTTKATFSELIDKYTNQMAHRLLTSYFTHL
jgi:hypothetical protein